MLVVVLAAAAIAAPGPTTATAQAVEGEALTLDAVVAAALRLNRGIEAGRRQREAASGELHSARGAYDLQLQASFAGIRSRRQVLDGTGATAADAIQGQSSSSEVALIKELRGGIWVQPSVALSQVDDPLSGPVPYSQGGANLAVTIPLGYNRRGELTRADVRVAQVGLELTGHQLRQVIAEQVHGVVTAFWAYRAAAERLAVHLESEARAERMLAEMRTLVAADERPAADLDQARANLASKRMARLGADHGLLAARHRLGLAVGLDARQSAALPPPATALPAIAEYRADAAEVARLLDIAIAARPDLAAAELQRYSARLLHQATRAAARPRLDLTLRVGYTGLAGSTEMGHTLALLYRDIPGLNLSLRMSYQAVLANREAHGRRLQRSAALDQRRLALEELTARTASAVMLAAAALEQSGHLLGEADDAAELYRAAVENEQRKYELGFATVLDVIAAEDNLIRARLAVVEGQLDYAVALATLRLETGTLVPSRATAGELAGGVVSTVP